MKQENLGNLARPRSIEGVSKPSKNTKRSAKSLAWRGKTLLGLMLLGWIAFVGGVPAQAQTEEPRAREEKAGKTEEKIDEKELKNEVEPEAKAVDTAAVLARLTSTTDNHLLGRLREPSAESNATFRRVDSGRDYTAADDASRAEAIPGATQSSSDGAQFQFTPYLWFIGQKGQVGPPGRPVNVDVRFKDIFDELNFGFMAAFEARWGGKWRFLLDMNYANLSDDKATAGPLFDGVQLTVKTFFIDPEIGYALVGNNKSSLDVLGGIRYWHLSTAIELRRAAERINIDVKSNFVDVVGGLRAKVAISERAFLSAKADVGGGGSDLTYQFFGGIGFNVGKRLTASFGYRYLFVNYRSSTNVFDVSQKGIIMGFGFRF